MTEVCDTMDRNWCDLVDRWHAETKRADAAETRLAVVEGEAAVLREALEKAHPKEWREECYVCDNLIYEPDELCGHCEGQAAIIDAALAVAAAKRA